jgi:type IV pilus biogenesis protein PilP
MSRAARSIFVARRLALLCGLASVLAAARAQTIADYSRAQRAMLEATMSQSAARAAGMGASAPVVAASAAGAMAAPAPRTLPGSLPPPPASAVQVSGVFAAGGNALAEVVVDATAYLLGAGQDVPGTSWRVESIAIDRVVLVGGSSAIAADASRKVFALSAPR